MILKNPHRRTRLRSRFSRTRRSRRNPATSAATKRKISLAVKRSFRNRKNRPSRRIAKAIRTKTRTITKAIVKYRNRAVARRSTRRRSSSRVSGVGTFNLRQLLSRDNLTTAGGVVGSSLLTAWALRQFGAQLPGITNPYARIGYALLIPVAGAYLTRRVSPALARGMVLGGIATAISAALTQFAPGVTVAATGEYLDANRPALPPGYDAANTFGASPDSVYDSQPAFKTDAWS